MLILGTYSLLSKDKGGCSAHIPDALNAGFNEIDIATYYLISHSVGKAIANKDNILVNTKIWFDEYDSIMKKVEQEYNFIGKSLNCVFLHWPKRQSSDYEAFVKLNIMKKEGWFKKIGLCNVTTEMIKDFSFNTGIKPDIVQNESHIGHIDNNALNYCKLNNIEYQGWGSMYGMNHPYLMNKSVFDRAKISIIYLILKGIRPIVFSNNYNHLVQNIEFEKLSKKLNENERNKFMEFEKFDSEHFAFSGKYPEKYQCKIIRRKPIAEFKE